MNCPKCDNGFEVIQFHEVELDRCKGCGGLWFDEGELKKIEDMELSGADISDFDKRNTEHMEHGAGEGKCPKCENPLCEINFMYESKIRIDACEVCGGLWLDQGELSEIMEYLSKHGDNSEEMSKYMEAYEEARKKGRESEDKIDNSLAESMILKVVYRFMSNFKLRK